MGGYDVVSSAKALDTSFKVFEEEFARFKGHFGPINTLAFHPNGNCVVSGGEDGYVRVQEFDTDYLKFDYDF